MKEIERIKELIEEADAIVIGAGAGLSTAAGFEYGGDYFLENFSDIYKKYGYTDMYSAGFHQFLTSEEKWGYSVDLSIYRDIKKEQSLFIKNFMKWSRIRIIL